MALDKNGNSDYEKKESPGAMVQIARYSQLALAIPAATIAGWFLGSLLDRWLHTSWIYLAGIMLGGVAGLAELIRVALKDTGSSP